MKAALEAMARRQSQRVTASDKRRLRDQGGAHHLRRAMFEIEKLGIDHSDWCKVQECLQTMIRDLTD